MKPLLAIAPVVLGAFWHTATDAVADDANTNSFRPAPASHAVFGQDTPVLLAPGDVQGLVSLEAASALLVMRDPQTGATVMDGELVSRRLAMHLAFSYGVSRRLELGAALSTAVQSGDSSPYRAELRAAAFGDVLLRGKVALWRHGRLRVGSLLELSLPTATAGAHFGESSTSVAPHLLAGVALGRAALSVQAGYLVRRSSRIANLDLDDELRAGVGASYEVLPKRVWLLLDGHGAWGPAGRGHEPQRPAEVIAGVRVQIADGWLAQAGLGVGVTRGYGTPGLRAVLSLGRVPRAPAEPRAVVEWTPSDDGDDLPAPAPAAATPELVLVGDRLVLPESVLFDLGGDEVKAPGRALLADVLTLWRAHPEWVAMAVEGHTDLRGSVRANQELSERRARNVRGVLIELGADPEALTAVGHGEAKPLVSAVTDADHARNRRVELVITLRQAQEPAP